MLSKEMEIKTELNESFTKEKKRKKQKVKDELFNVSKKLKIKVEENETEPIERIEDENEISKILNESEQKILDIDHGESFAKEKKFKNKENIKSKIKSKDKSVKRSEHKTEIASDSGYNEENQNSLVLDNKKIKEKKKLKTRKVQENEAEPMENIPELLHETTPKLIEQDDPSVKSSEHENESARDPACNEEQQESLLQENNEKEDETTEKELVTETDKVEFDAKQFRQLLLSKHSAYDAVKHFIGLCSAESPTRDFALEYLECGGNTSELIRIIDTSENKNASFVLPIVEALTIVLLKIISSNPQKQIHAEESCRELLNKHFSIIKSMISLNSTLKQRKTALKFLTAMVSLSPSVAKEVLSHANFDQPSIEHFCQPSNVEDGSNVRTSYIHFLISFLVDGHSPTIITFLEKRGFLAYIFRGLMYDTPEIINLVLSTIQTNILENKAISKTIKMTLFNTKIVKTIVNLYNWKGPKFWNLKQQKIDVGEVDKEKKERVCDIVHNFLLCLCASKHGIIFLDPTICLGPKKYNPLLLTVLDSLVKPWTNVYGKQLVLKICVTCPDLVKSVFESVDSFLEPRFSKNWLDVINFVKELIENLDPSKLKHFFVNLSNRQMALVIQELCVPLSILVKMNDMVTHDDIQIRHHSTNLLLAMLISVEKYLKTIQNIPELKEIIVKHSVSEYLKKNSPPGSVFLKDWYKSLKNAKLNPDTDLEKLNMYLTKLLDVMYQYTSLCPFLVENITTNINIKQFLSTIDVLSERDKNSYDMHIKAIDLLISCDVTIFAPSREFFSYGLPLLIKFYYHTVGDIQIKIEKMLLTLFKLTGVFDSCLNEISIWLYSILDQPNYDNLLGNYLTVVLVKTSNDFLKLSNEMANFSEQFTDNINYKIIIENLLLENSTHTMQINYNKGHVLSPFILGYLNLLLIKPKSKINDIIKDYLNVVFINLLHYQTNPTMLLSVVLQNKYSTIIETPVQKYYESWQKNKKIIIKKDITTSNTIYYPLIRFLMKEEIPFSEFLNIIELCTENSKYYTNTIITNTIIFCYTQKSKNMELNSNFQTKCLKLLLFIINSQNYCLNSILDHPLMLKSFSPTSDNESIQLSTQFIIDIFNELLKTKSKSELEIYLNMYQSKLVQEIFDMLRNFTKEENFIFKTDVIMDFIKLFDLSFDHCSEILNIISRLPLNCFKSEIKATVVFNLLSYIFLRLGYNFKPFSNEIMNQINLQLIELNKLELNLDKLDISLCCYIKQFPHVNINFDSKLFESLITKPVSTKSSVQLATLLLQNNSKYLDIFIKHLDKLIGKRELVYSLTNSILNLNTTSIKPLLERVYVEYEQLMIKYLHKPQKAANYLVENYQVTIKFITDHLKIETCNEFCSKSHKFDTTEVHHFETITSIFNKSIIGNEVDKKLKYALNYITTSMNLMTNILKRNTKTEEDWNKIDKVSKQFSKFIIKIKNVYKIEFEEQKIYSGAVFQTFAKLCLKFGLQEKVILVTLLKHICSLTSKNCKDLGILFEMTISHSETLNILLSEDDEKKAPLLNLLLTICKRCHSVMVKSHIPIWLSAYEATLSESDQYLLQLLSMYEIANIGFHEFRPYLWGKAGVGHYSVKSSIETTLWIQPKPKEVLSLFDENRIFNTVQRFPWARQLHSDTLYSDSELDVYDPAFYLPLLSHLFTPESTVRWYHCTQKGIMSLPIIALTSENEEIRAAACNVLARFHWHLEASTYAKQRFLWLHLIEAVCRGTSILPSLRPCTIVAVFLARCSIVFTRPDHQLYSTLGNYISAKECPNFNIVPELLMLLHSTDVNHNIHRNFILEVIRDGLCTNEDLKVLYKSVAFKLLMDLYNSVLVDNEGKKLILEILAAAVSLQNGARTLISSYNIISWLHAILRKFNKNYTELLSVFVQIINNLIISFEDDLFKHLQFNVLMLLVSIIGIFKSSKLELDTLVKYITVLYKVYDKSPNVLNKIQLNDLLSMSTQLDCRICSYYLEFGADFIGKPSLLSDDVKSLGCYYLELLTLKWIQTNKEQ